MGQVGRDPDQRGGEGDCGAVGADALVCAHRDAAPLLELVERYGPSQWGLRRARAVVESTLDELYSIVQQESPLDGAAPGLQSSIVNFIDKRREASPTGGR